MLKGKKILASAMALAMAAATVMPVMAETTAEATSEAATEETAVESITGTTPLVVGYSGQFSQKFSQFYADTTYDSDVYTTVGLSLMTTDRLGAVIYNGIEGETTSYNGTDYTYYGPADLSVVYDEESDTTTYTAKLREDLVFSDGVPVTADDLIFTYYVYLDNSYVGSTTLDSYDIVGLKNYEYNSTAAEGVTITADEVAAAIAEPSDEISACVTGYITNLLTSEMDWALSDWESYADSYGVASGEEFFVLLYSMDEDYTAEDKDSATILADVIAQYGMDYKTLGANYGDEEGITSDVEGQVSDILETAKVEEAGGEEVPNIAGIQKLDDYTVSVTTNGFEAPAIYSILGITIAPMHYYGDESLYDYENNMFGFERGNFSLDAEKATHPLGAGAYKFEEYSNRTVYFTANENYYKGEPKVKELQYKEMNSSEIAAGIQTGTIDVGDLSGTKARFEEVASYNSNGETIGDVITLWTVANLGYGYIGINADKVNVGGESDSDASKDLRKALATVLAVYRDTAVDSFYGDAAEVINYPITSTSWAAPQVTDEGYQVAYSTDIDGNPIYTSDMSADEKYAAALEAALGYFEAAGYTVEDGVLTAAPEGASLSYEVMIPAEGTGDHPSFAILTDAQAALAEIGFDLKINDLTDGNILWDTMDAGEQEIWCAAWTSTIDPDMYQTYYSTNIVGMGGSDSNHYHVADAELDQLILDARSSADQAYRKSVYKECLDIICDWAVEIPVYQRQNCVVFSTQRVNMDTVTPDITTFYGWATEIENIEMN